MSNELGNFGSKAMRVYDALVPKTGDGSPQMDADFVGQRYVDVTGKELYIAGSVDSGKDFSKQSGGGDVGAILGVGVPESADFVGQIRISTDYSNEILIAVTVGNGQYDWVQLRDVNEPS